MKLMDDMDDSDDSISLSGESDNNDADMVAMEDIGSDLELKENAQDYEILTADQLTQHMNDIIKEVEQIISAPPTLIRLLLARFSWDKDRLIEHFFERDAEQVFRESNLISPSQRSTAFLTGPPLGASASCGMSGSSVGGLRRHETASSSAAQLRVGGGASGEPVCEICFLAQSIGDMTGLGCGHYFCRDCWVRYLTWKIMEENQGDRILCPAHKCSILVDDAIVFQLVQDPVVRRRYQKLITNNFVMCNRLLAWCPGIECGCAVRVSQYEACQIICTNCDESFCFACGEPWHEPVRCYYLRKWLRKMRDDSETSNWIVANTKECPKCRATIEKNGGCNHMVCKNLNCKYEFCWVCLDQWEPHGSAWYNCNRYNEAEAQKARDAQEASRAALQRYLFYFNRYTNHFQSLRFEAKLYDTVQKKMEELQTNGMSWIEVKFIRHSVDVLCNCRRTLMYTYVFAYYLKKNNQSIIFESNQSDLEQSTEQLSEYLEREMTTATLSEIKQKVQDKSRYCANRRKVLLDHVREGYDKDMWEHLEL